MPNSGFVNSQARKTFLAAFVVAGIAGLFVFDVLSPRGQVDGVGYAALVAMCMPFGRRVLSACAIVATVLVVVAHFLLPDSGISVAGELANRFFALASIWIIAFLLCNRLALEEAIASREAILALHQQALLRIMRESLSADLPFEGRIRAFTEIAGETLGVERTSVFALSRDNRAYRCLDLWLRSSREHILVPDMQVAESPGYFEAIRERIVVAADDALNDPIVHHREELLRKRNIVAVVVAGIVVEGRMQGILSLGHVGAPRHWRAEEVAFAHSLSGILALLFLARERARLEARLQQSAKMQALGELAGGVAHDFNNILGAIMAFSGLLKEDLAAGSPQHGFAERILVACERGKDLVEQILAFARADVLESQIVNLPRVLREHHSLLGAALPPSIRLTVEVEEGDLLVRCREVQIGQLMFNLCRNASDSFDGKEGVVAVSLGRAPVDDIERMQTGADGPGEFMIGAVDPAKAYARIRVADAGSGMTPEVLSRVFEPFFTTKRRRQGTGIGLAVVHGVIEGHGGACLVKSAPGKGTVFSIYLPLADGVESERPLTDARLEILGGTERILVVDDEPDIADALCIGFERLGYHAVCTNDPLEALEAFEEDPGAWDIVVTDQLMPGMRGTELVRRLKAIKPAIPVIVCTGFSDSTNEASARAAGADAFFRKPVTAKGITPRLRTLLDEGR